MPKRTGDLAYSAAAKGSASPAPLMWLIWAVVAAACVLGVGIAYVGSAEVETRARYAGTLAPARENISVILPAGAVLDRIEVTRGQELRAGQTVATLDRGAMQQQLARMSAELSVVEETRICLADFRRAIRRQVSAGGPPGTGPSAQPCHSALREGARQISELGGEALLLSEERGVIVRYLAILEEQQRTTDPQDLKRVFGLRLAVSRLEQRIGDVHATIGAIRENRMRRVDDELRRAEAAKLDLTGRIAAIARLIENPRLDLPEPGRISLVRSIPGQLVAASDTPIVEAVALGTGHFNAYFDVPLEDAESLHPGDPVNFRLLGVIHGGLDLKARVHSLGRGEGGVVEVTLAIEPETIDVLTRPGNGLALSGATSASVIEVQRANVALWPTLRQSLSDALHWSTGEGTLSST